MCVFKNGTFYHYEFQLDGRRHRGSTGTASKPQAIAEERLQREPLEKSYSQVIEGDAANSGVKGFSKPQINSLAASSSWRLRRGS